MSQPIAVENHPGASGNIGMEQGAKAALDGYTTVEFAAMRRTEAARWAKLAREAKIRAD